MSKMMLASLLQYGLFADAPLPSGLPLSESEWQALFDESRRQAVTALTYDAILMLPAEVRPSRKVLFRFYSLAQTIEDDNRRREKALDDFMELCRRKLDCVPTVVKGSSLACLYREPLHRECGDNDLLTGVDTERVGAMVEGMGIAVDRKDPRHISFMFEKTTFECHSYLLYHNDDPEWHSCRIANSETLQGLPAEESAFFLAKHCEHHAVFFHNPVRLRTLIDWCLLLGSKGFDFDAFDCMKRGTDVDVFADLMTLYCQQLFGVVLRDGLTTLQAKGLKADDFYNIYMLCPERHRRAVVRVARRSWKYLRYGRQYRAIYGRSMFRRFYLQNLRVAIGQHL